MSASRTKKGKKLTIFIHVAELKTDAQEIWLNGMGRRRGRWHRDRDGICCNFRQNKWSGKKEGVKNDSARARHAGEG